MKIFTNRNVMGDSIIGIRRYENAHDCNIHSHEFIELVYIQHGEVLQTIDGVEYKVEAGDMIFIAPGASHSFTSENKFCHVEIFLSPNIVEDGVIATSHALALLAISVFDDIRKDQNGGKITFRGEERRDIEYLLDVMLREYNEKRDFYASVIGNYLNILLTKMLRRTVVAEEISEDIWQSLKDYIDNNPNEQMSLTSLAKKCFYNPSYFSRVFKQKFGSSPTEYIRSRRIEMSMSLLRDTDMSVEEIMEGVGFSDRSAFYHAFSKKAGIPPAEYRMKYKK